MTREEAINEIKSWAIPSEKGREVLETLIPELTESEDERIRRELKEAFAAYDIESKWNGIPIRSIFSWLEKSAKSERVIKAARRVLNNWLDGTDCPDVSGDFTELEYAIRKYDGEEKQKESLHIPETCKENAYSFTEDERIRQWLYDLVDEGAYLCERPFATESILAWLEKQKEKLGDISTILLVKKEIERRIETWQKSRKELIAMECNTLADDAAVRIEELYSLISFLGTIRCNTNEKQKEQNGEDEFLEDELSAFLQNYDKEYDDDAAVSDVARHFYEIGKKQNDQGSHAWCKSRPYPF